MYLTALSDAICSYIRHFDVVCPAVTRLTAGKGGLHLAACCREHGIVEASMAVILAQACSLHATDGKFRRRVRDTHPASRILSIFENLMEVLCLPSPQAHFQGPGRRRRRRSLMAYDHAEHLEVAGTSACVLRPIPFLRPKKDVAVLKLAPGGQAAYVTQTMQSSGPVWPTEAASKGRFFAVAEPRRKGFALPRRI